MTGKWKPDLKEPDPARPFVIVSSSESAQFEVIKKDLESAFGHVDYESETAFSPAEGRNSDIHGPIVRILSFRRPVGREELVDMHRKCLTIQVRRQTGGVPDAWLWPGYVTDFVVVRSHTMEDFHRVYLYGGIYGEVVLRLEKGSFIPAPWAHDFFRSKSVAVVFNDLRLIHRSGKPQGLS